MELLNSQSSNFSHSFGIPAECHTPEYHTELNLIRELVKLVWYSSY